jgi:hypothetical protein
MDGINPLDIGGRTDSFVSNSGDLLSPKETHKVYGFWFTYASSIGFILLAIMFLTIGIVQIVNTGSTSIHNFLFPLVLILFSCLISYFFPFYSSVTFDLTNKTVTCKKYKLFWIIRRVVVIQLRDIQQAYIETNNSEGYGNTDKNSVDGYNLVFVMKNGEKKIGLEGEVDINNEMNKMRYFILKYFPSIPDKENAQAQLIPPSLEE